MNLKHKRTSVALIGIITAALVVLAGTTQAATFTFIGGGTTDNWSDSNNWLGGAVPTSDGMADIILSSSATMSNVDTTWEVNSITQGSGAAYTLSSSSGASLQVNGTFDNASTSDLVLSATIANTDTSVAYYGLTFNSGTYRIMGSAMTYVNVVVNPAASVIVASSGMISSTYGGISVGRTGGTLGGSGTFITTGSASFNVTAPDGGGSGPTLVVGDPAVNGGVGTMIINTPSVNIGSVGVDTLVFAFGGGSNSLLQTTGDLTLGTNNAFNINSVDSSTTPGLYTLISYTGTAIDSATLATEILNLPTGWEGSLFSNDGVLGLDLTQTASAPEPQTWALMGLGLTGVIFFLARRKSSSLV
jgi:hypothetical protein